MNLGYLVLLLILLLLPIAFYVSMSGSSIFFVFTISMLRLSTNDFSFFLFIELFNYYNNF